MGPYNIILTFSTKEEADNFVAHDLEQIRSMSCTCMKLSAEEAERISRKNAVAFAAQTSKEALALAITIFQTEDPFSL